VTEAEFSKLIQNDRYQVFLFSCPATFVFSFASHHWFVINRKGKVERWEVGYGLHPGRTKSWGHVDLDMFPPHMGPQVFLRIFPKLLWPGRVLASLQGDEYSLAYRISEFIARSPEEYPFRDRYELLGPNSNTYAQWVLDHFPEAGMRLPCNAVGKDFESNTSRRM
jgi:hypothetical protein